MRRTPQLPPVIPAGSTANSRGRRCTFDHRDWIVHWLGEPLNRDCEVALLVPADKPTDMRRKRWVESWRIELSEDDPIWLPAWTPSPSKRKVLR